jgi:putative ABC transport system ATP-binding protein
VSGKTVILLENVKKIYQLGETRVFALKGINLTIREGEMVAVMGSSGSGKSTLLNIMGCLDRPTAGIYYLDGENVSQLAKSRLARIRNKRIGFVFQGFNLLGRTTVLANVQLPLIYAGAGKKEMAERAMEWIIKRAKISRLTGASGSGFSPA